MRPITGRGAMTSEAHGQKPPKKARFKVKSLHSDIINYYNFTTTGYLLYLLAIIFSGGIVLWLGWFRPLFLATHFLEVAAPAQASYVLVKNEDIYYLESVYTVSEFRAFDHRLQRFVFDVTENKFVLTQADFSFTVESNNQIARAGGLSRAQAERLIYKNGTNILAIPIDSFSYMFFLEIIQPFMVFQAFAFSVWCSDDYVPYAVFILSTAWMSAAYKVRAACSPPARRPRSGVRARAPRRCTTCAATGRRSTRW